MRGLLDSFFPPLTAMKRSRPEELLYWIEDRPPPLTTLALAAQHTLLALMFCIYAVIAGQGTGLAGGQLVSFVSTTIFMVGLVTLMHALRTRFTTGMLLVAVPSPVLMGVYIAVTINYGLSATMGALILANLCVFLFGRLLPRLRPFFPPEVVGVVVLSLGLSMIAGGASRASGLTQGGTALLPALTAGVTLLAIVLITIWGGRRLRVMAVLIGACCGVAVALLTGQVVAAPAQAAAPLFALPLVGLDLPLPTFVTFAVVPVLLVELISAVDGLANALTFDKLNDARWRRADMAMAGRAVNTTAMGCVLCGVLGCLAVGTSTANIGLARATGATARRIGLVAGAMLMVLACLPPVSAVIVRTPDAVIGGILLYTAAYMIVAGMDLSLSRLLDSRRSFTIGLSVVAGGAVLLLPQLVQSAPEWSRPITGSGLAVAAVTAILLNILLRIGVKQTARTTLTDVDAARAATEFLEHHGKLWGARRDVVARAGMAVGEAVETLWHAELCRGPVELVVSFDEFNLRCVLLYDGEPLRLGPAAAPNLAAALEGDDDAMEAAMRQVSAQLIGRLADRVQAGREGGRAVLRLNFDH